LELGGVIALADEITTIALMACDRSHRPGVSVMLTGERCCDTVTVAAESLVQISIRISKIGRLLGNVEMEVFATNANLVVVKMFSVRHIKYIDMGFGYENQSWFVLLLNAVVMLAL
jgi:hypothetical protein